VLRCQSGSSKHDVNNRNSPEAVIGFNGLPILVGNSVRLPDVLPYDIMLPVDAGTGYGGAAAE
jgi:hypothetical protein